ncbi:MAG: hypothetical protein K0S32_3354 [Bacteroidetes bacterium]|jgi:hypothetical protein|nr:hypothetical protein [Bacteroidota bacterium]
MKKTLLVAATFLLAGGISAQGFNGSIDFKYSNSKDTTNNTYYVKDKMVKLDQFSRKTGNIEGSFIFDMNTNTIKWINPKRKVWGEQKSETPAIIKGKCEVTKGTNTKMVQGVKCNEYIVKNTEENTVITYWIAQDKFNFFVPIVKLWNRKDKQSVYFSQITGLPEGSMPLLSEEKQLSDGKALTRLEVVKINKTIPDEANLKVPSDYNKFDK